MPWKSKPLITYTNNDVDYYLFVDESGDHVLSNINSKNDIFTVAGVVIEKNDYLKIEEEIDVLKNRYWDNGTFSPKQNSIKKVCFVSRDIRKRQKAFSKYYLNDVVYESFIDELTMLMKNIKYKIIASSISKSDFLKQNTDASELYHEAMEFIVDKFVRFLHTKNCTGLIMMEARGKKEDAKLHQYFLNIYNNGLDNLSSTVLKKTLTGGFYFNGKWNKNKDNLETFCGLELADLVAHPIGHYRKTDEKSRPFNAFESKFLGYKKYLGIGLRV